MTNLSLRADRLERLLTAAEVSEITGRSLSALAKDRMHGVGIPHVKIRQNVRYMPKDVRAFIEANRRGGQAYRS